MNICINVGHTIAGFGSGTIGIKNESIENRKVATEVIKLLRNLGHTVTESRVDSAKSNNEYLNRCGDFYI